MAGHRSLIEKQRGKKVLPNLGTLVEVDIQGMEDPPKGAEGWEKTEAVLYSICHSMDPERSFIEAVFQVGDQKYIVPLGHDKILRVLDAK